MEGGLSLDGGSIAAIAFEPPLRAARLSTAGLSSSFPDLLAGARERLRAGFAPERMLVDEAAEIS
jgi:hypothetical protein